MARFAFSFSAAALALAACAPKDPVLRAPPDGPFVVSDYYAPSGAFGDGATPGNVVINENLGCKERPPGARGHCFSFVYRAVDPYVDPANGNTGICNFAGVFWQTPPNNWGSDPGLPIESAFPKLRGARFYAAVDAGAQAVSFGVGGLGLPPGASAGFVCPPTAIPPGQYYDQIGRPAGMPLLPQTLTTEWSQLEVPLEVRAPPVTTLLSAFSWSTAWPGHALTVYVDDLVYEGKGADGGP